jgi:hypothetical protein
MKLITSCRSHRRVLIIAGALGLILLAAPIAQAFTIDEQSNTNSNGSAKFSDPESRLLGTDNGNGPTTIRNGNTTLQFGSQRPGADRNFNTDRIFNPNGRPGDDR